MTEEVPARVRVLWEAARITCGDRNATYGSPVDNMAATAALWSAFLGVPVTGAQVAVCMSLLKIARLKTSPAHEDSHVDGACYLAIACECAKAAQDDVPAA